MTITKRLLNFINAPVESYQKGQNIPAFDGIRGVAATLVIIAHFYPFFGNWVDISWISVDGFFVLSGFLITNILLKSKSNRKHYFRNFYARRVLRVFPVYYLILIVVLFITPLVIKDLPHGYDYFLDNRIYYFSYLQNSLFQRDGYPPHWMLSHTWSLAIEEQFYILWPMFVFFLPNRWLLIVMAIMISLAIALRFSNPNVLYTYLSTPTRMDALLVGSTLAIMLIERKKLIEQWALPAFIFLVILILYAFKRTYWHVGFYNHHMKRWGYTAVDMAWASLFILSISTAKKFSWIGKFFRFRIFCLIGKYSYGIYLYHFVLFTFLGPAIQRFWENTGLQFTTYSWPVGQNTVTGSLPGAITLTILTVTMAVLSFHLFEMPFLRLKKYFARY